ncbi:Transposase, Mutator family [Modestobacter sp. DSM 44400]|uniref:transposase n=1 Tax=Modestobacter sp. DSM 44400 TaxID=1550230 RepID=UPI00089BA5A4|nr:Transposase, Mutator family [Modestobacter sp. DSM 44400]
MPDLVEEVAAFPDRSLADRTLSYAFLDATDCAARLSSRVISQALVDTCVAAWVHQSGPSYVITADIYSHVAPAQRREAADRLDEALEW